MIITWNEYSEKQKIIFSFIIIIKYNLKTNN